MAASRNFTLSGNAVAQLDELRERLTREWGTPPSYAQTLAYAVAQTLRKKSHPNKAGDHQDASL